MDETTVPRCIGEHNGPVILDLDETLYLRNSTQEFLNLAAPATVAALLLRVLQLLKPWRLTGHDTADCWRVIVIVTLFPWTLARWKRHVRDQALPHLNRRLAGTIDASDPRLVIATLGFGPIVRPLVAAMGFGEARLISCGIGFADRKCGKYQLLLQTLGEKQLTQALVLTDSEQDRPLLDACAHPFLIRWPDARYRRALHYPLLPFDYLTQIKRPGKGAAKAVFLEDFSVWILATFPFAILSWTNLPALLLLFLSFWSIYEAGYADNDHIAATKEKDPALTDEYHALATRSHEWRSWIFGLGLGAAGITLLGVNQPERLFTSLGLWALLLAALRLVYWLYNRVSKKSRILLYPPLQIFRAAAFSILIPMGIAGVAFVGALALSRWIGYFLYRYGKEGQAAQWPDIPLRFIRFVMVFTLLFALFLADAFQHSANLAAAAIGLVFHALLARHQIIEGLRSFRLSSS